MKKWAVVLMSLGMTGCIYMPVHGDGITYKLPKAQPLWPGEIVRCDQPEQPKASGFIYGAPVPINPTPPPPPPSGEFKCHWECEYGETTETFVEDGNRKVRANGCGEKEKPPVQVIQTAPSWGLHAL